MTEFESDSNSRFVDYSCVTIWECFVNDIETVLRKWNAAILFNEPFGSTSKIIKLNNEEYVLEVVVRDKTGSFLSLEDSKCDYLSGNWQDLMSCWFGVRKFILLSPSRNVLRNHSESYQMIHSAIRVAMFNSSCCFPGFVSTHPANEIINASHIFGLCLPCAFYASQIQSILTQSGYAIEELPDLSELGQSLMCDERYLNDVGVSIQFESIRECGVTSQHDLYFGDSLLRIFESRLRLDHMKHILKSDNSEDSLNSVIDRPRGRDSNTHGEDDMVGSIGDYLSVVINLLETYRIVNGGNFFNKEFTSLFGLFQTSAQDHDEEPRVDLPQSFMSRQFFRSRAVRQLVDDVSCALSGRGCVKHPPLQPNANLCSIELKTEWNELPAAGFADNLRYSTLRPHSLNPKKWKLDIKLVKDCGCVPLAQILRNLVAFHLFSRASNLGSTFDDLDELWLADGDDSITSQVSLQNKKESLKCLLGDVSLFLSKSTIDAARDFMETAPPLNKPVRTRVTSGDYGISEESWTKQQREMKHMELMARLFAQCGDGMNRQTLPDDNSQAPDEMNSGKPMTSMVDSLWSWMDYGSPIGRMQSILSLFLGTMGSAHSFCTFWKEFVQELRLYWEGGVPLPRMNWTDSLDGPRLPNPNQVIKIDQKRPVYESPMKKTVPMWLQTGWEGVIISDGICSSFFQPSGIIIDSRHHKRRSNLINHYTKRITGLLDDKQLHLSDDVRQTTSNSVTSPDKYEISEESDIVQEDRWSASSAGSTMAIREREYPVEVPFLDHSILQQKLQLLHLCILCKSGYPVKTTTAKKDAVKHRSSVSDDDDDDDEYFDAVDNPEEVIQQQPIKKANVNIQKQRDTAKSEEVIIAGNSLFLLMTGRPTIVPKLQRRCPLTSDSIEFRQMILSRLDWPVDDKKRRNGSFSMARDAGISPVQVMELQVPVLMSDMSCFKNSNPDCVLADFVRWYAPEFWIDDEEVTDDGSVDDSIRSIWAGVGRIDSEILGAVATDGTSVDLIDSTDWRMVWKQSVSAPIDELPSLFDPHKLGEELLNFFESISPMRMSSEMLSIAFCTIHFLLTGMIEDLNQTEYFMSYLDDIEKTMIEAVGVLRAEHEEYQSSSSTMIFHQSTLELLDKICVDVEKLEVMLARASVMSRALPHQDDLVARLVASNSTVLKSKHEQLAVMAFFRPQQMDSNQYTRELGNPEERQFVMRCSCPRPFLGVPKFDGSISSRGPMSVSRHRLYSHVYQTDASVRLAMSVTETEI